MFRRCAVFWILWLSHSIPPLCAAPDDPALIGIQVAEGEGASYAPGSRATRGVTVQVSDETGKPVEGAAVTFRLPEEGPGGVFGNGSKTEIAATRADGRATVWGMQWNRTPGAFELRITASKGGARAGTVCSLRLAENEKAPGGPRLRSGHKWLWVGIGVAAAAGTLAVVHGAATSPGASVSASGVTLGTPTVAIGRPQ